MNPKNNLYSIEYQQQLINHHNIHKWGGAVVGKIPEIIYILELMDVTDVLDYGCGYGALKTEIEKKYGNKYVVNEYDPGISSKSTPPSKANLVVCVDVLEHIEPELIDNVLDNLNELIIRIGFFVICLVESKQKLSDGRNAHLLVQNRTWWREKIEKRFVILNEIGNDVHYKVIVKKIKKD